MIRPSHRASLFIVLTTFLSYYHNVEAQLLIRDQGSDGSAESEIAGVIIQVYERPEADTGLSIVSVGKDIGQARSNLQILKTELSRGTDLDFRTLSDELVCDRKGWWTTVSGFIPVRSGTAPEARGYACGGSEYRETIQIAVDELVDRGGGEPTDYAIHIGYASGESIIFDPNSEDDFPADCYWLTDEIDFASAPQDCLMELFADALTETGGSPGDSQASNGDLDTVTPQVTGCPRYLKKSMVTWKRKSGSDSKSNIWQVENVTDKVLMVTYLNISGTKNNIGTLIPGGSAEVGQLPSEPAYVVRSFSEVMNLSNSEQSLKCESAIRPR